MGLFSRRKTSKSKDPNGHAKSPTKVPSMSRASSVQGDSESRPMPNIPEIPLPKAPDPWQDPVAYLRSIYAVRERSSLVLEKAKADQLKHFDVDMNKFKDTASYVVSIIKRDFSDVGYQTIPPHGRWQHFDVGGRPRVEELLASWPLLTDNQERCRRLLDLFLVSVLLDAGAGNKWQYKSNENGRTYRRSEGLAVASLEMFKSGLFSSDPTRPHQVDAQGLRSIDVASMAKGLQVTEQNPIAGLEGRTGLLMRLADALEDVKVFGVERRPGYMLDYLLSHPTTLASSVPIILLPTFWETLMTSLGPIWPSTRTQVDGVSIGDAWPLSIMPQSHSWESIVPFHKLTQWLCYSLMVPMQKLLHVHFAGAELMTGLPEYRNGGLLVDTGLLTLKKKDMDRGIEAYRRNARNAGQPSVEVVPLFTVDDDVIVEWRAVTVGFLDELLVEVNSMLGLEGRNKLNLPQMLEAGSWKGGRELAEVTRPNTKEPPIMILSDGTSAFIFWHHSEGPISLCDDTHVHL